MADRSCYPAAGVGPDGRLVARACIDDFIDVPAVGGEENVKVGTMDNLARKGP